MKRVVILQSNYIPWKGYFDLIRTADEFVLYDDVQYTRRDWRNRNAIKTSHGLHWLSIPVEVKGKLGQRVRDTKIAETTWASTHWKTIAHAYAKAPYFKLFREPIESLYRQASFGYLSEVNRHFLDGLCALLGIKPRFRWSNEFRLAEDRSERLASICADLNADVYVSGPAGKAYMDEGAFSSRGISVEYFSYAGYVPYPQIHGEFVHGVSVVDLLFNTGLDALTFLHRKAPSEIE